MIYNPNEKISVPKIGVPTIGIPKIPLPNAFGSAVREEKKDDNHDYGYIRDGLVFHLDGIDKGTTPDAWTDLVGGVVFENHGAVALDNCWKFVNVINETLTSYLSADKALPFYTNTHTIEIVFSLDVYKNSLLFATNIPRGYLFGLFNNGISCSHSDGNPRPYFKNLNLKTDIVYAASIRENYLIINKEGINPLSTDTWGVGPIYAVIGGRFDNTYPFIGKIYSVRFYDRLLTEEEMLHNQDVDYKRFDFENAPHNAATARINNLNEVNSPQNIVFPSTIYNSLSEEEIALATSKGWSVVSE